MINISMTFCNKCKEVLNIREKDAMNLLNLHEDRLSVVCSCGEVNSLYIENTSLQLKHI